MFVVTLSPFQFIFSSHSNDFQRSHANGSVAITGVHFKTEISKDSSDPFATAELVQTVSKSKKKTFAVFLHVRFFLRLSDLKYLGECVQLLKNNTDILGVACHPLLLCYSGLPLHCGLFSKDENVLECLFASSFLLYLSIINLFFLVKTTKTNGKQ